MLGDIKKKYGFTILETLLVVTIILTIYLVFSGSIFDISHLRSQSKIEEFLANINYSLLRAQVEKKTFVLILDLEKQEKLWLELKKSQTLGCLEDNELACKFIQLLVPAVHDDILSVQSKDNLINDKFTVISREKLKFFDPEKKIYILGYDQNDIRGDLVQEYKINGRPIFIKVNPILRLASVNYERADVS
ncbi:MAG: hypothetical protein NZT61_02630 [Deltaproteobacteria bacterium]|nr:hypothetical protein [Deltaproteobacteria bacterium]MCX7952287.1 hypothetical protein [Deltaproteobacteria bacterium]